MITARTLALLGLLISSVGFGQVPQSPETRLVPIKQITQTGFGVISNRWRYSKKARHHSAVVRVQTSGGAGTGCVIDHDGKGVLVVTNHHVVARAWTGNGFTRETFASAQVVGNAGSTTGRIIYSDPNLDIAIIHSPNGTAKVSVPISEVMPPIGTDIEICGYGGPQPTLRTFLGRRVRNSSAEVSCDAGVVSGDSGGPMIWNGALVGVNYGAPAQSGNMGQEQGWNVTGPASSNIDGPTLAKVLTQQCTPYGCIPRIIRRPIPQQNVISEPPPATTPIVNHNSNCQCESQQGCDCDVDAIKAEILASLDLSQLKGADGATGAQGPMGPKGSPGVAGQDAHVDINELAEAVIARLPPIYMRRVNDETKEVIAVEAIHLGEGWTFFETPGVTANAR